MAEYSTSENNRIGGLFGGFRCFSDVLLLYQLLQLRLNKVPPKTTESEDFSVFFGCPPFISTITIKAEYSTSENIWLSCKIHSNLKMRFVLSIILYISNIRLNRISDFQSLTYVSWNKNNTRACSFAKCIAVTIWYRKYQKGRSCICSKIFLNIIIWYKTRQIYSENGVSNLLHFWEGLDIYSL